MWRFLVAVNSAEKVEHNLIRIMGSDARLPPT